MTLHHHQNELERLHDISTGLHWLAKPLDLLIVAVDNPPDFGREDFVKVPFTADRLDDVILVYKMVASASVEEMPILAKIRLCRETFEPFLATVLSKDDLAAFKAENRLNDGFVAGVMDIEAALDRVHKTYPNVAHDMLYGKSNEPANDKILQVALGDLRLNVANVQQVYLALQDLFSKLDQGLEIDQSADAIMPAGTYGLRLACQNYLLRNGVKLLDHGDLSVFQQIIFTS